MLFVVLRLPLVTRRRPLRTPRLRRPAIPLRLRNAIFSPPFYFCIYHINNAATPTIISAAIVISIIFYFSMIRIRYNVSDFFLLLVYRIVFLFHPCILPFEAVRNFYYIGSSDLTRVESCFRVCPFCRAFLLLTRQKILVCLLLACAIVC